MTQNPEVKIAFFKFPGFAAAAALTMLPLIPLAAQARDATPQARDVTGVWMSDDGEGAVEIKPCGDKRCGNLVWLKTPLDKAGHPMRDGHNPDPALRQRRLCGVDIIKDAVLQTDGSWDGGSVYDPDEGKEYTVMLKPGNNDRLEVRGYLGIKALGETVIWTRAPAQLKLCQPETTSKPK